MSSGIPSSYTDSFLKEYALPSLISSINSNTISCENNSAPSPFVNILSTRLYRSSSIVLKKSLVIFLKVSLLKLVFNLMYLIAFSLPLNLSIMLLYGDNLLSIVLLYSSPILLYLIVFICLVYSLSSSFFALSLPYLPYSIIYLLVKTLHKYIIYVKFCLAFINKKSHLLIKM